MVRRRTPVLAVCLALGLAISLTFAGSLVGQEVGTASGKGTIERTGSNPGKVPFSPRFSFAYREGSGAKGFTWIVLTEKEPPAKEWATSKNRAEARQTWCGKEKTPWVAVKLDAQSKVDLYFLCPADGGLNTEMLSSMNGLESVVVKFAPGGAGRLKGTLKTGQGNCPGADGKDAYCTPTGDFAFDAPMWK